MHGQTIAVLASEEPKFDKNKYIPMHNAKFVPRKQHIDAEGLLDPDEDKMTTAGKWEMAGVITLLLFLGFLGGYVTRGM